MSEPNFGSWCDEIGPRKIIHVWDPDVEMRGILVVDNVDNVACGPAISGLRMAPDLETEEVFRLARAMTLKNAVCCSREHCRENPAQHQRDPGPQSRGQVAPRHAATQMARERVLGAAGYHRC